MRRIAIAGDLSSQGWSCQRGTLADVRLFMASNTSWSLGLGVETALIPKAQDKSPRRSLSAVYGLGRQPLHTDGAHLRLPPDIVVLHGSSPSSTPTDIWFQPGSPFGMPAFLDEGIFTVHGDGEKFLSEANNFHRLRFDPVVMVPGDDRARQAVEYFSSAREEVYSHEWSEADMVLFINNRLALHARQAVSDAETRQIDRICFFHKQRL